MSTRSSTRSNVHCRTTRKPCPFAVASVERRLDTKHAIMDKLQAMQVFTRVVDCNSFSGAADALHMTRSSVTTIIQNLEAYLNVRLLNRTTRRISLTPDGAAYYERCARILAAVEDSETSLSTAALPRGKLKSTCPARSAGSSSCPRSTIFMHATPTSI